MPDVWRAGIDLLTLMLNSHDVLFCVSQIEPDDPTIRTRLHGDAAELLKPHSAPHLTISHNCIITYMTKFHKKSSSVHSY